jgi:hypothetical protein
MNKFEQLIEYVINDDEAKARELFHDIVVEKSRAIYEEMMEEEEQEESVEEALEEEESIEENMDGQLGGDQVKGLIDDIETEESGISMDEDEMGDEFGAEDDGFADEEDDAGLEDRVVDLEDKLDELMAEFESLMGDEAGEDDMGMDDDMDDEMGDDMSGEEVVDDELETEGMFEAVTLKAVPKPTHGDNGQNAKSPVAANSGARGAMAHPVKANGDGGNGRPAPTAKDLIGRVQNTPAQSSVKQSPAPKPHLAQATGVNTKSVIK